MDSQVNISSQIDTLSSSSYKNFASIMCCNNTAYGSIVLFFYYEYRRTVLIQQFVSKCRTGRITAWGKYGISYSITQKGYVMETGIDVSL